jgi:hypothetical protein
MIVEHRAIAPRVSRSAVKNRAAESHLLPSIGGVPLKFRQGFLGISDAT